MPNLTFKIPVGTQTFAARARRKAGMGSFFARVATPPLPASGAFSHGLSAYFARPGGPLPPPGIFSRVAVGMNSFFSDPVNRPLPAPGVFAPLARGMRSFFARPAQAPPLPAGGVFAPYASRYQCLACRKRGFRRGMGQSTAPTFSVPNDLGLMVGPGNYAPTVSVPSDLNTLFLPAGPSVSTSTPPFVMGPSSDPALDAYNQALTNAAARNAALLNPSTLSSLGTAAGAASPAQLQAAATALANTPASSASLTQQIANWLAGSTVISGVSNSTVAFGGAAAVVLLAVLGSKKKGRR